MESESILVYAYGCFDPHCHLSKETDPLPEKNVLFQPEFNVVG